MLACHLLSETITPRRGRISTNPAEVNWRRASRTGVRDNLNRLATAFSSSRAPGGYAPHTAFALSGAMLTFFGFMYGESVGLAVTPRVAIT
jgi:hypothetical protein